LRPTTSMRIGMSAPHDLLLSPGESLVLCVDVMQADVGEPACEDHSLYWALCGVAPKPM
jgi:hypothetical protein